MHCVNRLVELRGQALRSRVTYSVMSVAALTATSSSSRRNLVSSCCKTKRRVMPCPEHSEENTNSAGLTSALTSSLARSGDGTGTRPPEGTPSSYKAELHAPFSLDSASSACGSVCMEVCAQSHKHKPCQYRCVPKFWTHRTKFYCFCDRSVREKAWRSRKCVAQAT